MELIMDATVDKLTSPDAARWDHPRRHARVRKLIVSAVIAAFLIALPGAATAQASSPTSAQYDDQVQLARQQTHQAGTASPDDPTIGALPFTGVDLVILAVVAMALVGAGAALHRWGAAGESDDRA
jgi:hypothetical protein